MHYGQCQPTMPGTVTPGAGYPGQYDPNMMDPNLTMPPYQQPHNIETRLTSLEQQVRRLNARVSRLETAVQEPTPQYPPQFQTTQPFDMVEGTYPSTHMM